MTAWPPWWPCGSARRRAGSRRSGCTPPARATPGSDRNFRRPVAEQKALWQRDHHRRHRPAVWSPGEHPVIDGGQPGRAARVLRGTRPAQTPERAMPYHVRNRAVPWWRQVTRSGGKPSMAGSQLPGGLPPANLSAAADVGRDHRGRSHHSSRCLHNPSPQARRRPGGCPAGAASRSTPFTTGAHDRHTGQVERMRSAARGATGHDGEIDGRGSSCELGWSAAANLLAPRTGPLPSWSADTAGGRLPRRRW